MLIYQLHLLSHLLQYLFFDYHLANLQVHYMQVFYLLLLPILKFVGWKYPIYVPFLSSINLLTSNPAVMLSVKSYSNLPYKLKHHFFSISNLFIIIIIFNLDFKLEFIPCWIEEGFTFPVAVLHVHLHLHFE